MRSLTSSLYLLLLTSTRSVLVTAQTLASTATAPSSTSAGAPPPCAAPCIAQGLAASPCNSSSNLTCICTDVTFGCAVGGCELATCTTAEFQALLPYVNALCAPVASEPPEYVCPTINATTPGDGNLTSSTNSTGSGNGTVVGGATPVPSVFTGGGGRGIVGSGVLAVVVGMMGIVGLRWL